MSDDELSPRLAIEAQYARLNEAVRNKDLDAFCALHAPDYRDLRVTGQERGLAEVAAEWRGDLADLIEPRLQTEVIGLDLDGDKATVKVRSTRTSVSLGFASRRLGNRIETTGDDHWIHTNSGWHLWRSERQTIKTWVEGELDSEASFEPPLTAEQRAAVVRDLRVHAIPFKGVLAGSGFDDLMCLDRLIGDARIVALGEATHGTAEFFQMKHRLIEYLVERKGFSVVAIEGNWPEAQVADRFIKTGEGDAGAALAAMYFWTWQTQEVAALLHWMRRHNSMRAEGPRLSFAGFDMQVPNVALKRVIDFLDRTGSAERDAVSALYDGMAKLDKWGSGIPADENARMAERAGKALRLIEAPRETPVMASTPGEYRDVRQAARVALQAFQRRSGIPGADRDRAMAENVRWLVEEAFPGQKVVVWAHNGHVGTGMGGSDKSLGDHLRDRYGDQMVVIGFATHHGEVRARRIGGGSPGPLVAAQLAPVSNVSLEAVFWETGLPRFILDLRGLPENNATSAWLATPKLHRMIGAVYDPDRDSRCYAHVRLREMYDGIVFIADSTASQPLK